MVLFSKALFLVTNFPKIIKNSIFILSFHQKFSQNFNTCHFSSKARKSNAWFDNFFENYAKLMHFSNSLKKILENYLELPKQFVFFVERLKIKAGFVKPFDKYAKIMDF